MKALTCILLIIATISIGLSQSDKRLKGIEKEFEKILEVTKAPGFAVAIVEGNKTIYSKGFGFRDVENKIPMDQNTLMAIGSSSKAFTCSILGQLREEGKLSFSDSPMEHVKGLKFYNDELNNGVNIKDLMTHQTGIPRHDIAWYLFSTFNRDSLIQKIQYLEPFTDLRQKWYYNNFMFLVQGVIAERITGKSWEENVRERFFAPLGMTRSNLSIKELEQSTNKAKGYELYKDSLVRKMDYYEIAAMAPAGSINSSVHEMANWLKVWINNGRYNGKQILPENYLKEAMSSHAVIDRALPTKDHSYMHLANYGYGWMISSYKGHYQVEHGGHIDGFSSSVGFFPSDSIGIVVLTNQNVSPLNHLVRNTVADRLFNVKRTDWVNDYVEENTKRLEAKAKQETATTVQPTSNSTPSHEIRQYEGMYFNPGYGRFSIYQKNDSLFAHFKKARFYLKHDYYDIFQPYRVSKYGIDTTQKDPVKLNFGTNDAGEIASVKIRFEPALDHAIEFVHEPKVINLEASKLKSYEGEYEISGMTIKVYLKNGTDLYLQAPGQPEFKLLASENGFFVVKELDGYKAKFMEGDEGRISELVLIQPNGTFKAKKKR